MASRLNVSPAVRAMGKFVPEPNSGCWLWDAAVDGKGYGEISAGRRGQSPLRAHRVIYEHLVGPIPDGMDLDHLCRVPICVNPDHLEPVTRAENLRRGLKRQPGTHCQVGHIWADGALYISPKGKRHCRICQRERERRRA